jgi:hypothetical protein
MAREVQQILRDDNERARRARNGTAYVKSFPDEEGMARRIEEIVQETIRRERKRDKLAAHGHSGQPALRELVGDSAA